MKNTVKNVRREQSKTRPKKARVVSAPHLAPVAQSQVIRKLGRPKVTNLGEAGDILVIHREYISDLIASATAGAFAVAGIPINPGNISMFPWLSGIASNFESYVFRGLKFLFETSAPTSTPGTVLMAVDYDQNDPLPADKSTLMSLRDATRSAAWERNRLDCHKEDLHKRKTYYVTESSSTGLPIAAGGAPPIASGVDSRLDDVGELLIASSNSTASAALGELYVEYEVVLQTPQGSSTPVDYYSANKFGTNSTSTADNPFGAPENYNNNDSNTYLYPGLGIVYSVISSAGGDSYFLFTEPGTYSYQMMASSTSVGNWTITNDAYSGSGINTRENGFVCLTTNVAACATGLFVVRNTLPRTFAGDQSQTGVLGWLSCSLGAWASNSASYTRIRVSKVPDFDSNQSNQTGWVDLKMPARASKRERRSRKYSCENRFPVHDVAGSQESSDSEKPRVPSEPRQASSYSEVCPTAVSSLSNLRGVRSHGH
jgi:hypothetical protein